MDSRTVAGRYELIDRLGTGGGGIVWRARDLELGRHVAVKEITFPAELGAADHQRLRGRALREARAAARLEHPNVVSVFDVRSVDEAVFIVMELVDAPSLKQLIDTEGPQRIERVATIGLDVLAALEAAHDAGILHRDVKPSNLLVGDAGVVVTDFGIASVTGDTSSLTSTGQALGTPDYVSPEQVSGQPVGPATDLWGLGATLYAAVEGQPPFRRDRAVATVHAVVTAAPRPTARAGALDPLLRSLLAKRPEDRPDVAAARHALQQVLDGDEGDPTTATKPLDGPVPAGVAPVHVPDTPPPPPRGSSNPPPPSTPPVAPPSSGVEQYPTPEHQHRGMRVMAVLVAVLLLVVLAVRLMIGG